MYDFLQHLIAQKKTISTKYLTFSHIIKCSRIYL